MPRQPPPTPTPTSRRSRGGAAPCLLAVLLACLLAAVPARAETPGAVQAPAAGPAEPAPGEAQGPAPAQPPATQPIPVTVDRLAAGRPVAPDFLGLSFEAAALDQIAALGSHGDFVRLLRSLGPGVLRFGGITADQNVAWTDALTPRPAWATSVIGPQQMKQLGVLARRTGWRVLLTVGLAHYEPLAAAREVAAAHAALGRRLEAVEIGNEPDSYGRHGYRPMPWAAQGYEEEVGVYREAIAASTPGVAIAGPDISGSGLFPEWGYAEAVSQRPALLTGHHYPLGCAQTPRPSIEALLSPEIRGREARSLATYLSIAQSYEIPLRMDETGSVSCGGVPGISNTFAAALWATAYVTQAMADGAAGINLEGNPTNCGGYTPLCAPSPQALAAGEMQAEPPWYALLLTRSLLGERPLPTTIGASVPPNLVAQAFSGRGHVLRLVLVDDEAPGTAPLALRVAVGETGLAAGVQTLAAPALAATAGVRLAGRAVLPDGSFRPPPPARTAAVHGSMLSLSIPAGSAELVTLAPRPRAHRRRAGRHG